MLQDFDYVFAENGLVAYKAGELLAVQASRPGGRGHTEGGCLQGRRHCRRRRCSTALLALLPSSASCSAACAAVLIALKGASAERRRPFPAFSHNTQTAQSLSNHLGEANLKELINFCLKYLAGALLVIFELHLAGLGNP